MCSFNEGNFAGRIVQRLGEKSCLINAATGQTLSGGDLPNLIAGFAAGFLSAGLRPGDRVLIQCGADPAYEERGQNYPWDTFAGQKTAA